MSAGPAPIGLACFAAIKFAGYTAAAVFLRRHFPAPTASPWLVGGVRTVLGMAVGVGAVYLAERFGILRSEGGFYALLIPIRMCEWLILLGLFYRRPAWDWGRSLKFAVLGTLWSYLLDVPAIVSVFLIPGGMWIC